MTAPSDAGITRPHLSRMVNVGTLVDTSSIKDSSTLEVPSVRIEEKEVLVHEVSRNLFLGEPRPRFHLQVDADDSLAGVSLKYGINMADLRRANHLWASDSIHMRKVLYIPIEKASRAHHLRTDYKLVSISPAEEISDPLDSFTKSAAPEAEGGHHYSNESFGTGSIRRIPASHLSFFPPASINKQPVPVRPSLSTQQKDSTFSKPSHSHTRYASSPSHSLTSILTALPIAASTRDTIIARLSFESVSSSHNGRQSEGEHLELDDVSNVGSDTSSADDYVDNETPFSRALTTPKASHLTPYLTRSPAKLNSSSPTRAHAHVRSLSSSPQAYIPPHTQIRTVQMEPSPTMQLPRSGVSRSKGKAKPRDSLVDFELEGASSGSTRKAF